MNSNKMDRKITIEQATETQNSANEVIKDWKPFASVWAKKTDTGGSERFRGAVIAAQSTDFEIRYLTGVNEKMRVKYDGNYYNIFGVVEIGRLEGLLLRTEKQDHGYNT